MAKIPYIDENAVPRKRKKRSRIIMVWVEPAFKTQGENLNLKPGIIPGRCRSVGWAWPPARRGPWLNGELCWLHVLWNTGLSRAYLGLCPRKQGLGLLMSQKEWQFYYPHQSIALYEKTKTKLHGTRQCQTSILSLTNTSLLLMIPITVPLIYL